MNDEYLRIQKYYLNKYENETEGRRFFSFRLKDELSNRYIELPKTIGRGYEFVEDSAEYIANFYGIDITDIR